MADNRYLQYLAQLRRNYVKLARLEFLNPGGGVAFTLDNQRRGGRSRAFLQDGSISCNLQNGRRRQASVTLANADGAFEYAVNKIWFGQQIRLSEGLLLPDGTEYIIPQGVFEIENPDEGVNPNGKTVTWSLVDKWARLDGALGGNLEGAYGVNAGTNIFAAMKSLLLLDRYTMENNGQFPIDPVAPLFTSWYNGKTQTLTDGSTVNLTDTPYDFLSADDDTMAEVLLGLSDMLAAWIGYNPVGRLTVDPSQDDIEDATKPVLWEFSMKDKNLWSMSYNTPNTEVFNDIIVTGETGDDYASARGRAQNRDESSDTCISRIGLKTRRIPMANYYSDQICEDYAAWQLKRAAVASKSVTVSCQQMFHIVENQIITIQRTDKPGNPVERHVVQGFSRPLGQKGSMTINAVSVADYPMATVVKDSA